MLFLFSPLFSDFGVVDMCRPVCLSPQGGRTLAGTAGPVLLPPSSHYAPSGSIYRQQMSPSRTLEEGVQMVGVRWRAGRGSLGCRAGLYGMMKTQEPGIIHKVKGTRATFNSFISMQHHRANAKAVKVGGTAAQGLGNVCKVGGAKAIFSSLLLQRHRVNANFCESWNGSCPLCPRRFRATVSQNCNLAWVSEWKIPAQKYGESVKFGGKCGMN